jgi:hypothetical protein
MHASVLRKKMMTTNPDPFVSADIDLKGFPGFVLDVEVLLASELIALATPDEIAAALMLWCRAWQQTPHGSLPNDERVLSAFSRAKNWKKVRDMALRGFVLCSDGRLYHKTLCEKVNDAWAQRLAYKEKREKDAVRLAEWRNKKRNPKGDGNAGGNAERNDDETRFDGSTKPVRSRSEVEVNPNSVPNGTGAAAPPEGLAPADAVFQVAVPWLVERGMPEKAARSLLGAARKQLGDDGAWALASDCMREKPLEPAAWLAGALNSRIGRGKGAAGEKFAVAGQDYSSSRAAMEDSLRRNNITVPESDDIPL